MREVKFEVSYADTNEIIGHERINTDGHWEHLRVKREAWILGAITDGQEYKKLTRRQFTGLKDKNGVEIYEGDIDSNGMIVTYCGNQEGGLGMNAGWYLQKGDFEHWIELESRHNDNGDNHIILGNIWQNPELLKV